MILLLSAVALGDDDCRKICRLNSWKYTFSTYFYCVSGVMKKLKGIIFDLDGTLVDSRLDFAFVRQEMGFSAGQPILKTMQELKDEKHHAHCLDVLDKHE